MWIHSGRHAPLAWRQTGDAYVAATLAPRDNHRSLVQRGPRARAVVTYEEAAPGAFNPAWARNANTLIQVA